MARAEVTYNCVKYAVNSYRNKRKYWCSMKQLQRDEKIAVNGVEAQI